MSDSTKKREFLDAVTQELARLRAIIAAAIQKYPTAPRVEGTPAEVITSAVLHKALKDGDVLGQLHMFAEKCALLSAKADELTEFSSPVDIGLLAMALDAFTGELGILREWAAQTRAQITRSLAQLN